MNQQQPQAVPQKKWGCFSKFFLTVVGFAAAAVAMYGIYNIASDLAKAKLLASPQLVSAAAAWVVDPVSALPTLAGVVAACVVFLLVSFVVSRIP